MPVSMFLARDDVMQVFTPGDHGSTFGGNPLACAVARTALEVLEEEHLVDRAALLGDYFLDALRQLDSPLVTAIRGRGLLIGVEIDPHKADARQLCERLLAHGILSKETHETVIRFAPPLVIRKAQIDETVRQFRAVLQEAARAAPAAA